VSARQHPGSQQVPGGASWQRGEMVVDEQRQWMAEGPRAQQAGFTDTRPTTIDDVQVHYVHFHTLPIGVVSGLGLGWGLAPPPPSKPLIIDNIFFKTESAHGAYYIP